MALSKRLLVQGLLFKSVTEEKLNFSFLRCKSNGASRNLLDLQGRPFLLKRQEYNEMVFIQSWKLGDRLSN